MKKRSSMALLVVLAGTFTGCARPGEFGYTPGLTTRERGAAIARNWDYEGKQLMDDIDSILLLRPASQLTPWHVR